ncbi:MAG TPA: 50S ribosomal protein L30e [Candidatus Bilamarchaeum sp.]|nr:50S ribosomal protein L30e [Candidatus Bilamarchaeum sp.]
MSEEDEKVEETTGESEEETAETAEAPEGEAPEEAPEGEAAAPKEKKQKKVVRRRKTKRERENPLTTAVRLAVESGKVDFGARSGLAASTQGKAKLLVVAGNAPPELRERVLGQAKASKTPVLEFEGSSMELGSVCGKPFPISVLSVYEEGSSNILDIAKKK